jgi:hypothetical protein
MISGMALLWPRCLTGIATARTFRRGLEVYARLDEGTYPDKIRVTDAELQTVNIHGEDFHPEWNYTIVPRG